MSFKDVIYTDETTVQMETHRRTCCYKRGQKPRYKPKPKHPLKVHVWTGISYCGRTSSCIFEGKMNAPLFISILKKSLVPFIRDVYPDGHQYVQDNDPKHCSKREFVFRNLCGRHFIVFCAQWSNRQAVTQAVAYSP